jgi:protein-tyrosine phosphatase
VLAARARQVVTEEFSRETNGKAIMDVYQGLSAASRCADVTAASDREPGTAALAAMLVRAAATFVRRRWRRARLRHAALRRMQRMRREPARLTSALRRARRILVVCHGNIIRSPFAAHLLARALRGRDVSVTSAGLAAVPGRPPHPTATQLAASRDVDLSDHQAAVVTPDMIESSDVIFVMDLQQLVTMHERFPDARHRTFLLACLHSDSPLEVRDPVDGDESVFRTCFDHISRAVQPIVSTLDSAAAVQ